jgi:hypothetical protein
MPVIAPAVLVLGRSRQGECGVRGPWARWSAGQEHPARTGSTLAAAAAPRPLFGTHTRTQTHLQGSGRMDSISSMTAALLRSICRLSVAFTSVYVSLTMAISMLTRTMRMSTAGFRHRSGR